MVLPQHLQRLNLQHDFKNTVLTSIAHECGNQIRSRVSARGIEYLHLLLTAEQIAAVYKRVEAELYNVLPDAMNRITLSLNIPRPLYIHNNSIARIMVPVEQLVDSFKFLPGRLYPYDGVHQDPFPDLNVVNFWIAIGHVKKDNGIAIYPDAWGQDLPQPGNNTNTEDLELGEPVRYELNPGDILMFHSRHIHATVPNHTDQTRVALTSRISNTENMNPAEWIHYTS